MIYNNIMLPELLRQSQITGSFAFTW